MDVRQKESGLEHAREKLFADPAQGETGQGNAELRRGEIGIEVSADVLGENRLHIAFVLERIELAVADLHDGKLGGHEKGVERNQPQDDRQLAQDDDRRIPVLSNCVRQGCERYKW